MNILSITYPETITPDPAWEIIDTTKINMMLACRRRFFFEEILGWKHDNCNIHLEFGTAIHYAMEHIYKNLHTDMD